MRVQLHALAALIPAKKLSLPTSQYFIYSYATIKYTVFIVFKNNSLWLETMHGKGLRNKRGKIF
jgi:hypothetical protein